MSDGQILLIALGAFTLFECLRWVPTGAWIFQPLGGGAWRTSRPWTTFRARGGGVIMLMPVPPLEPHVIAAAWPCVPHEHGLCIWHGESGATSHVPWDQVTPAADGVVLRLAPDHHVRCIHAASAMAWAALTKEWVKQSSEQRRESFLQRASLMLDVEALNAATASLEWDSRWLRRIGGWIFFWCFFILPVTYWRFADGWPTLAAAAVLLVLMLTQAVLLTRRSRREPRLRGGVFQHIVGTALFPPSSMRAADWYCASCSPEVHPLAALKAWREAEELKSAAARIWREARWPMGDFPNRPWKGPEVEALAKFFELQGLKIESLEAPPSLPEGCNRWCPRCHTPYQDSATECTDCGGMKLISEAGQGSAANE